MNPLAQHEKLAPGVGVWGVGNHAQRSTLPALSECPAVRLVGLTTRSEKVREEQARKWNCKAWKTPRDMLQDPEVEVVYLATPVGLHHEHGLLALQAGRHLWCEKSLTASLDTSQELVEVSTELDVALCEAFMYQHHPQFRQVLQWIVDGQIGQIRSISSRFGFPHLGPDDIRYVRELGGGALLDVGCYPLSAALAIAGEEPDGVHAVLGRDEGYAVDTAGSALLRFPSGISALLEWGFGRAYRNELEVWGEDGTIIAERAFSKPPDLSPRTVLRRQDGTVVDSDIPPANQFVHMFATFAGVLEADAAREEHRRRALRQARTVAAVLESAHLTGI
ncbi:MAG: Gfo/Idh/MocA family oxidoreductase [Gemmatimonadota bacterium]|nr:MAG: Gfo/Idh/MocA family oxidoreductase [Gemmatimonadota bacterium]